MRIIKTRAQDMNHIPPRTASPSFGPQSHVHHKHGQKCNHNPVTPPIRNAHNVSKKVIGRFVASMLMTLSLCISISPGLDGQKQQQRSWVMMSWSPEMLMESCPTIHQPQRRNGDSVMTKLLFDTACFQNRRGSTQPIISRATRMIFTAMATILVGGQWSKSAGGQPAPILADLWN